MERLLLSGTIHAVPEECSRFSPWTHQLKDPRKDFSLPEALKSGTSQSTQFEARWTNGLSQPRATTY